MNINPKIKEILKKEHLDTPESYWFLFSLEFESECSGMVHEITELVGNRTAQILHNLFWDGAKGKLKYPLFPQTEADYKHFKKLLREQGVSTFGYDNNPTEFSIGLGERETEEAFQSLVNRIGDNFEINTLVEATVKFYKEAKYPKKLVNFFNKDAFDLYDELN